MNKMKTSDMSILLLNNLPIESGVGRYTYNLYASLKDENIQILNFPNYFDYKNRTFEGKIIIPKFKNKIVNLMFNRIINESEMKFIYNFHGIVHYTNHNMPIYKTKALRIATIHDFFPFEYKNLGVKWSIYLAYMQRNLKHILKLENIIVTTNIMKYKLINNYKYNGKIFVVPYSTSPNFIYLNSKTQIRKKLNFPENKILVLSVSNDAPHKNLNILPNVMKLLGDDYLLVRVGKKIYNSITIPYANNTLINEIYNACDVLVFPSLDEGFGFPMIEAFATGLPVVASDIPVFHEIGGDAPIYVNNKDPESIANGIRSAIANKEEFTKKSLERSKLYTLEELKKKMISVYESLI